MLRLQQNELTWEGWSVHDEDVFSGHVYMEKCEIGPFRRKTEKMGEKKVTVVVNNDELLSSPERSAPLRVHNNGDRRVQKMAVRRAEKTEGASPGKGKHDGWWWWRWKRRGWEGRERDGPRTKQRGRRCVCRGKKEAPIWCGGAER